MTAPFAFATATEILFGRGKAAHAAGHDVARVHSGDPSLYGAIGEQIRRLDALGIPYDITPGVPAYAAAAALLRTELTLPEVSQTVILTRTAMKSSSMPNAETLDVLGRSGGTLAIHLSIQNLSRVTADLIPHYGPDCPVAVVWRASWPDQKILRATLSTIEAAMPEGIERTALILVGPALGALGFTESRLYAPDYDRRYRPQSAASAWAGWSDGDD